MLQAHVILEESLSKCDIRSMPEDARARLLDKSKSSTEAIKSATISYLFVLSANDCGSLSKMTALIAEYVNERPVYLFPNLLKSLAFTLGQRRTLLPWKVAIQAADQDELIEKLKDVVLAPTRSAKNRLCLHRSRRTVASNGHSAVPCISRL